MSETIEPSAVRNKRGFVKRAGQATWDFVCVATPVTVVGLLALAAIVLFAGFLHGDGDFKDFKLEGSSTTEDAGAVGTLTFKVDGTSRGVLQKGAPWLQVHVFVDGVEVPQFHVSEKTAFGGGPDHKMGTGDKVAFQHAMPVYGDCLDVAFTVGKDTVATKHYCRELPKDFEVKHEGA